MYKYFEGENIHFILEVACKSIYPILENTYFKGVELVYLYSETSAKMILAYKYAMCSKLI